MPTQNYLHIWDDRLLYIAPSIASGMTVRSTATLLISLTGKSFTLRPLNGTSLRYRAALVAPHVARGLEADSCGLLSLNLDPVSVNYHALRKVVGTGPIHEIDWRCFGNLRDLFEGVMHGQIQGPALHRFTTVLINAICQGRPADDIVDARVKMVMQRLQCDSEKNCPCRPCRHRRPFTMPPHPFVQPGNRSFDQTLSVMGQGPACRTIAGQRQAFGRHCARQWFFRFVSYEQDLSAILRTVSFFSR